MQIQVCQLLAVSAGIIVQLRMAPISQVVRETDKTQALILCPKEGGSTELPLENFGGDVRSAKYDASSEFNTHFAFNQRGQDNFQTHNATGLDSVVIKVEVDPNLYVNCDTAMEKLQSDCHLKKHQCNKPSVILSPKTHCKVNSNRNVCVRDSGTEYVDITNNVGNKQGQIADSNNSKQFVEDELDNKWKNMNTDDSENEASELSEGESEFCTRALMVEESIDSYDLVRRHCNSEEQMDLQLSQFYKFECDQCSIKQTFRTFKLLVQHCKDEHQSRGCVLCCDQTMWEIDELLDHMCSHKHAYR
jgi:hypothetical protein